MIYKKKLVSKIYKELIKLSYKKNPKNRQKVWTDASPKNMYSWQINMKQGSRSHVINELQITTTHLLEWLKSKTLTPPSADMMWGNRNFHSLLVGMQTGTISWEDSLAAYYKPNIILLYYPAIMSLDIYPNKLKTYPHKNLPTDVYRSFICNCQHVEVTKISFSGWMDKLDTSIQ